MTFADVNNDGRVEEGEILQEEHYYPFGLRMEGYGRLVQGLENPYNYNGKELNEDFDLDWLDYGARWYDASLGRFHVIDRFAEKYYELGSYHYTANNPLKYIDVNGDSLAIYLYSSKASSGISGHTAVLIMNSEGKWNYISKDGGKSIFSGESIYQEKQYDSLEDFANDSPTSISLFTHGYLYEGYMIETSQESNDKAIEAASMFEFDEVIDPADTRKWICSAMANHQLKANPNRTIDSW